MQHVVITGVTKGCGRALVEYFAGRGVRVTGCGRDLRQLNVLGDQLRAPHFFQKVDVSKDAEVRRWAEYCLSTGPAPDLLINNAAVIARTAPLWELSPGEVQAVLDVNLQGTINVIRHFLPAMIRRGSGVVVNFSSGWGRSTSPNVATYCATKWGIEGLTAALAQELPTGLAAVALNPGIINTDMLRSCFGEEGAKSYPTATEWARSAGPFLEKLGAKDNGAALTVPNVPITEVPLSGSAVGGRS
jgi:NAD(P)-dependent dehydrogenase (short-subunit alcohol dehydrogenase family)